MKIFLAGYMGSGKSTIGKMLAEKLSYSFKDLDEVLEQKERTLIPDIFLKRGEIYFRKQERKLLEELLSEDENLVISLGGGTPCYGNNMELIKKNEDSTSIYLKMSVQKLTERLYEEKSHRPLISHLENKDELEEFIRKHLFERGFYYNQSNLIINCDDKIPEEITAEIEEKLR